MIFEFFMAFLPVIIAFGQFYLTQQHQMHQHQQLHNQAIAAAIAQQLQHEQQEGRPRQSRTFKRHCMFSIYTDSLSAGNEGLWWAGTGPQVGPGTGLPAPRIEALELVVVFSPATTKPSATAGPTCEPALLELSLLALSSCSCLPFPPWCRVIYHD